MSTSSIVSAHRLGTVKVWTETFSGQLPKTTADRHPDSITRLNIYNLFHLTRPPRVSGLAQPACAHVHLVFATRRSSDVCSRQVSRVPACTTCTNTLNKLCVQSKSECSYSCYNDIVVHISLLLFWARVLLFTISINIDIHSLDTEVFVFATANKMFIFKLYLFLRLTYTFITMIFSFFPFTFEKRQCVCERCKSRIVTVHTFVSFSFSESYFRFKIAHRATENGLMVVNK